MGSARSARSGWRCSGRGGGRLARLEGRFTAPVFPGDAIGFEAWDDLTVARAVVGGTMVMGPVGVAFAA